MRKKTTTAVIIALSILLAFFVLVGWLACRQTHEAPLPEQTPDISEPTVLPTPEVIEASGIRILLESTELTVGSRFWPEVIIQPYNATDKSFELYSDNERVVRQQGNSWVAAGLGMANLIATAPNGIMTTVVITVTNPDLESLSFPYNEITMHLEDELDAVIVQRPVNAVGSDQIRFTSDNERIATVSDEGKITAVGVGTTTITASVGDVRTELRVTVIVPVRSIIVSMSREVFRVGELAEYRIQVEPENATNASVSVSFSGARVTPSGANMFLCEEAGEVTITFTAGSGDPVEITIVVLDLEVLADEVFRLTNRERANAGLPNLLRSPQLTPVALLRAGEIIIRLDEDHKRPDGRDFHTILDDYNIDYMFAGENLAAGQTSPAEVVRAWMDSRSHRETMLNPDYSFLGVGVAMDHNGRLYWVQMFID